MSNPNDDPDVISGLCDDAKKEMMTNPGTSHECRNQRQKESEPALVRTWSG